MTKGAGLDRKEIKKRIITSTDLDLRYYMMKEVEQSGVIVPEVIGNWKFVPEDLVAPLAEKDRAILFSPQSSRNQK